MSNAREADNNWDENSGRRRKQRQFRQPNAVALVRNPPAGARGVLWVLLEVGGL